MTVVDVNASLQVQDTTGTTRMLSLEDLWHGTYGYAAGTAAATIDVPTGAKIRRVSVVAGAAAAATVSVLGGATITIPAGGGFDEQIPGDAIATASTTEVVIGGSVQSYYVAWVL